jgi:hypothetical protein
VVYDEPLEVAALDIKRKDIERYLKGENIQPVFRKP